MSAKPHFTLTGALVRDEVVNQVERLINRRTATHVKESLTIRCDSEIPCKGLLCGTSVLAFKAGVEHALMTLGVDGSVSAPPLDRGMCEVFGEDAKT